jgi:hypothetical protein
MANVSRSRSGWQKRLNRTSPGLRRVPHAHLVALLLAITVSVARLLDRRPGSKVTHPVEAVPTALLPRAAGRQRMGRCMAW